MNRRFLIICLAVFCLFFTNIAVGLAENTVRAEISAKPDPAYVGQHVRVNVDVFYEQEFAGAPTLDLPEADGGILLSMASQGTHSDQTVDGQRWHVVNYELAFFPQREGVCNIPEIALRFAPETGVKSPIMTSNVTVSAQLPPDAEGVDALVSAPSFSAGEQWQPVETNLLTGDSLERVITRKADQVLGMGFPPIRFDDVEGLRRYETPPTVKDSIHRGDLTGERIDACTYVCEQEGTFILPEITLVWFDLGAKTLKNVVFPARTLHVQQNPGFAEASTAKKSPSLGQIMAGLIIFGLFLILATLIWVKRAGLKVLFSKMAVWLRFQAAERRKRALGRRLKPLN